MLLEASVKGYGIADIIVGIITFVLEVIFFSGVVTSAYDQPYTGIWSGSMFMTSGMIALKRASSTGVSAVLFKGLLLMATCFSTVCGLVLLSLKAAAIDSFATRHGDEEEEDQDYTSQLVLESLLLLCGLSATIINGLLFYLTHTRDRLK